VGHFINTITITETSKHFFRSAELADETHPVV